MAFFNRKNKDQKKKGESIIGKIIYSCLLFAPIMAVAVACMYVIFNKNAYQSYSDSNMVERTTEIATTGNIVSNLNYEFKLDLNIGTNGTSQNITYTEISIDWEDYGAPSGHNYSGVNFYKVSNNQFYVYLQENGSNAYTFWDGLSKFGRNLQFSYVQRLDQTLSGNQCFRLYTKSFQKSTLDEVFYFQLERLEDSDLFNWSKNTATYDVVHNTTTLLGITNTYTPMLLTYWLIISVIYFIYDIALILIWAVHDKIHELKDAI